MNKELKRYAITTAARMATNKELKNSMHHTTTT
jgi:hypothetical protein